ncbi:MAG: glycosyltransferase family 2 protein [Candidatus Roizmanbacteria bacterium]|nr:glycosyltransferase family 2 protein [Candidatus Roizmanbacteria bacterium]
MLDRIVRSKYFHRLGEMLVPFFTWVIILLPLWLSPFHPAIVAYFIIAFDLYFLVKSILTAYYATLSYSLIRSFQNVAFDKNIQTIKEAPGIQHFVIIPNYKEPIYKIHDTLQAIVNSDYPYETIHLVLAFEKREDEAISKAKELRDRWGFHFKDVLCSYHELIEGEVPGKASNQTFAARIVEKYCIDRGYDFKNTLMTICDADSLLPKNFFSYLTFEFLKDTEKDFHFYWAPVLLYNNFWQLPFFVRMQATLSSILRLAFLSQKNQLIHISTYSTNLWLLKEIDYWDVDIIPEDWHVYYQAFFKFGQRVRTLPLYTIVNGDAVYSGTTMKTFINRYEQEKRWAWGVTDISYFWNNMFIARHIPWGVKAKRFFYLVETHLLWPTSFFILTVSGWIPPIVNPTFKRTVLGFILPRLTGFILTLATAMLILYIYLDVKLRSKLNQKTKLVNLPLFLVQWYMLPLVSLVLSSLPALDAHTRLLFGKKIKYKVTEKI